MFWASMARFGLLIGATLVVAACGPTGAGGDEPVRGTATPSTRAAQTAAARGTPTPPPRFPTAVVMLDSLTGRPIWPTPPATCNVSPNSVARPDLGQTIGEGPVWLAAPALPIVPWRNELLRLVLMVDRAAEGDLVVSGRRSDGDGAIRFIRQGAERATEQLTIRSAGVVGAVAERPTNAQYADLRVRLELPAPGCYAITSRLGTVQQTFTIHVYN